MRWVKLALAVVVLGPASSAVAQTAAHDPVAAFYGATLEIENFEGWHARRWLAPDHTFTQDGSDGQVHGTWVVDAGKLCTMQDSPVPPPDRAKRYCNLGPGHQVGDKWEDRDPVTGNAIFFNLTPGR